MNEFNVANIGRPLAKIMGGKLDKRLISVAPQGEVNPKTDKTFTSINLPEDAKFQVVPDSKRKEIFCILLDLLVLVRPHSPQDTWSTTRRNTRRTPSIFSAHSKKMRPLIKSAGSSVSRLAQTW